jgi:uridine kinase
MTSSSSVVTQCLNSLFDLELSRRVERLFQCVRHGLFSPFLSPFGHVMQQPCKIIGISGGSGAGKTTLANALLKHYQGDAMILSYDRYYKTMPCGNYDIPKSLDTELLLEHLHLLKSGQAVDLPIYDRFKNQRTSAVERVESKPIIIVEGIFALHYPELLDLYHCKVFVETSSASVRFRRRMIRDIRERGDTEALIAKAWVENVLPMHRLWVGPQCDRADVVVSGEEDVEVGVEWVVAEVCG